MNREEAYQGIYMSDVFGKTTDHKDPRPFTRFTNGMLVARGLPYEEGSPEALKIQSKSDDKPIPMVCPIMGDKLPYKSVSVVCKVEDFEAVEYWLSYVHGGGCIEFTKDLEDGTMLVRSNYMCW